MDPAAVRVLPHCNRGRPLLLGSDVDDLTMKHLRATREAGGIVNTRIAIAAAMGIAKALKPSLLAVNGGVLHAESKAFAKSLLNRMNFVKRKATKTCKKVPDNLEELRTAYTSSITNKMAEHNIPPELVINLDETGLPIVPVSQWTFADKGSKQIPVTGLDDKRQITGLLACSLSGELLPPQMIYQGTTDRCHPRFSFPPGWDIFHSSTHWSTHTTMVRYVEKILQPYCAQKKKELALSVEQKCLVVMDVYKAHRTPDVLQVLEANGFLLSFVPANCTSELQPLDLSINRMVKDTLCSCFTDWYAQQVSEVLKTIKGDFYQAAKGIQPDLRLSALKPIHASWVIKTITDVSTKKDAILSGWTKAGITPKSKSQVPPCDGATLDLDVPVADQSRSDDEVLLLPDLCGFEDLSCSVWRGSKVHEWTLPALLSQHRLDGHNGSSACTLICAELISLLLKIRNDMPVLPGSGEAPSAELIHKFLQSMRRGNSSYDQLEKIGLLGLGEVLESRPDLCLSVTKNSDLGFWNPQHCEEKLPSVLLRISPKTSTAVKAAMFMQTPYTVAIFFQNGRFTLFDSHGHGSRGALIAVASKYATPPDIAAYFSSYMRRQLHCTCPSSQITFLELIAL